MPFTPAPQKKCQRCAKSVYQAEEKKDSNGNPWHKTCFVCVECRKGLDSTTLNMHGSKYHVITQTIKNFSFHQLC